MNARQKLLSVSIFCLLFVVIVAIVSIMSFNTDKSRYDDRQMAVDINAIEHQIDSGDTDGAKENLHLLSAANSTSPVPVIVIISVISIGFIIAVFGYVYLRILLPFEKMHDFASKVAAGDLDTDLRQERGQYFGDFTWAFDSMRKEIKKAREAEKESVENNKIVIATLSHDIKTPIASIRSYSEALEANLDKTPEKRSKYLHTIIDKCDEVSRLTDDLFIHSVSDMDRMSVNCSVIDLNLFFDGVIDSLNASGNVAYSSCEGSIRVNADSQRLIQICENIIGNANKYAPGSEVEIKLSADDDKAFIEFRDFGTGIPEENLPFITQKFYRGANVENVAGSGLGLYIVNYLCNKMNATLEIYNKYEDGKCAGLFIRIGFTKV